MAAASGIRRPFMTKIAPSILSADFARLGDEVRALEQGGADFVHLDVMDGHFVPNITIGPDIVRAVNRVTNLPLDVHLMVTNPENFLEDFIEAGADYLTVHVEAQPHLHRTVTRIQELGAGAGVSLNPSTPASFLEEILPQSDLILVMSVNPGFGGQSFIPSSLDKVKVLREMIDRCGGKALLEVDGGIKVENAAPLREAGADILVSGSGVFGGGDYGKTIARLRGD
jgi:ribulose-phosphate 3-epimerase